MTLLTSRLPSHLRRQWCIAKNVPDGPDTAKEHYSCENDQGHEVTVATWNAVGKNVLAINTVRSLRQRGSSRMLTVSLSIFRPQACGDDGFMIDGNACYPNAVAVCLDASNPDSPKNCKYLAAEDDCTWPDPVLPNSVPSAISVHYRR